MLHKSGLSVLLIGILVLGEIRQLAISNGDWPLWPEDRLIYQIKHTEHQLDMPTLTFSILDPGTYRFFKDIFFGVFFKTILTVAL
jgi:hypothetical protein